MQTHERPYDSLCGVDALPVDGGVEHDGQRHGDGPSDGPRDPDAGRAEGRAGEQFRQRHTEHEIGERRDPEVLYEFRVALPVSARVPCAIRRVSAHQQPFHAAGHRRRARSASSSARAIRSASPQKSWSGCCWPPGWENRIYQ